MKKIIVISLLLLFVCEYSEAQTLSKSVIGFSGGFSSNGGFQLSSTSGEAIVGHSISGGLQLSNGYFPSLSIETLSQAEFSINASIKVYPNPSSHFIYIEQMDQNVLDVSIVDFNGKLLFNKNINSGEAIDVSSFASGIYCISVHDIVKDKENTYKIIKH